MKVAVYPVTSETDDFLLAQSLCEYFGFADYEHEQIDQYDVVILVDYHSGTMDEFSAVNMVKFGTKVVLVKSDEVSRLSRGNDEVFHLLNITYDDKVKLMRGNPAKLLAIPFLREDMETRLGVKKA